MALVGAEHARERLGQLVGAGLGRGGRGHPSRRRNTMAAHVASARRRRAASPSGAARPAPRRARTRQRGADLDAAPSPAVRATESTAPAAPPEPPRAPAAARVEPVARAVGAAGLLGRGARPWAPPRSSTSSPRGDQRGRPGADQLVHALGRRAGHRAGHAHHAAGSAGPPTLAVLSAPLRAAASTTTVPRGQRGDEPVAGQEPHGASARSPAPTSETTAPCCGQVVEEPLDGPRGRPGRRRRPAPRPSVLAGQRAPVGRLVDAEGGAREDRRAGARQLGRELGRGVASP